MTPITVAGRPSSRTSRPITERSAPKRRRQSPSLNTTTWFRPGVSSSAAKVRPSAGATPSRLKKSAPTRAAGTFSGCSSPARLSCWG